MVMRDHHLAQPLASDKVCSSIQRLLIFHLHLESLSGRDLDESASEEELGESVLYYGTSESLDGNTKIETASAGRLRRTVQFVGLCRALFQLPGAVDGGERSSGDRTKEVHLRNHSLVFEILEHPHVVAVAQLPRPTRSPVEQGGGNPAAVRAALRRSHQLFRLLRGGGVLHRLGDYENMNHLYYLQKKERKLRQKQERNGLDPDIVQLRRELDGLKENLPISSIREDLRIHYDSFLVDLAANASEIDGACQTIVECLPAPVPLMTGGFSTAYPASPILPTIVARTNALLKEFLLQAQITVPGSPVFAVSAFVQGRFIATHVSDVTSIPNETTLLVFSHMSYVHSKMAHSSDRGVMESPSSSQAYTPLTVSIGKDKVEDATSSGDSVPCRFMPPPPLALLSASDEAQDFQGPASGTRVWAPRVSLPQINGTVVDARACLYESDVQVSFLLFVKCSPRESDTAEAMLSQSLQAFDEMASSALGFLSLDELKAADLAIAVDAGQDIVLVDRTKHALSLLRKPGPESHNDANSSTMHRGRLRLLTSRFYSDRSKAQSDQGPSRGRFIDPRYELSSSLSLESHFAFDDAMAELRAKRHDSETEPFVEICSLLPGKWFYAYFDGTYELYVFFDTAVCVTVNDVHASAERIRSDLIETRREEAA